MSTAGVHRDMYYPIYQKQDKIEFKAFSRQYMNLLALSANVFCIRIFFWTTIIDRIIKNRGICVKIIWIMDYTAAHR